MPRNDDSVPIGRCSGATPVPNRSFSWSRVRSNEARSRSSLLTKIARGMPRCSAIFQATSVCTSMPSTAETTNSARSAAWSAAPTSPMKSAYPGASSRFTLCPSSSNGASASETEIRRRCSSGSKSHTVVPSSILPRRLVAPAANSRASASEVLPAPPCPTRATLRMLAVGNVFIHNLPRSRSRPVRGSASEPAAGCRCSRAIIGRAHARPPVRRRPPFVLLRGRVDAVVPWKCSRPRAPALGPRTPDSTTWMQTEAEGVPACSTDVGGTGWSGVSSRSATACAGSACPPMR